MKTTYKQLKIEEREKIAIFRAQGKPAREIARLLGRDHSTVLREIARNGAPVNHGYYLPHRAQERSKTRKQESGKRKKLKSKFIRRYVREKLKIGWSPEQIAGRISVDIPEVTISHEAIYQYIYAKAPHLRKYLARRHRKRLSKKYSRKHQSSRIPYRVSIAERPPHINERSEFGHWETDSAVSKKNDVRINILVERKSRFVQITKMRNGSSRATRYAIIEKLSQLSAHARKSITYDNGFENFHHHRVNKILGTLSYFCHPFHSWEKGTVENTIGLIRRFIPKGTDIAPLQKRTIKRIENALNGRPRKCLGFRTPAELFGFLT